jgi:curved DNA-binding protein CbpA
MNMCICGNPADGNGTTCKRCTAFHELGLKAGATDAEVKTAYRLYVKAWHPDRFPGDVKSKSAAQEKLKTINSAYDFLTSSSSKSQTYQPKAAAPPPQPDKTAQQKQSSAKQPPRASATSQAPPRPPNPAPAPQPTHHWQPRRLNWTPSPGLKSLLRVAAFACAVGFSRLLWQTFDTKPTENAYTKAYDQQRAKALGEIDDQKPNSGTKVNPQSENVYDRGKYSYNQKKYVSARLEFTQACDSGEMKACNYLGYLYAQGLGGEQDKEKARDVYQKACDQETLSSCASLGSLYQDSGDKAGARKYFQKACDGGVNEACNMLHSIR